MAFWLYTKEPQSDGSCQYLQDRGVTLAGGGLIWQACSAQLKNQDAGWEIDRRDLLEAAGADADANALVIDTAPSRSTVNLYEIRSVSGYSYVDWTPLMLTLEELFLDEEPPHAAEAMKQTFNDAQCSRSLVREFLYVLGGFERGTWNWGGNSRTTAALLWEDAWAFFLARSTG